MSALALRLKQLRNEKKLRQQDVADYLNITSSAYGFYEQEKRIPDSNTLQMLANLFEVSSDYLLGQSNIKNANASIASDPQLSLLLQQMKNQDSLQTLLNEAQDLSDKEIYHLVQIAKTFKTVRDS
jgi:transcriptional regulator with XRE-family HTH domain